MVEAQYKMVDRSVQEHEWGSVICRLAEGDHAALSELYDTTSHLVYGLALRILGDPGEAEEVTLEVFEQIWRQAADYNGQRGTPMVWLMMMTRSRAIDRLRILKRHHQREEPLDDAFSFSSNSATPEQDSITAERQRLIQMALADLKPEQREVIELAYFQGLSQSEIAEHLDQPLGTVKTRVRLGMMKLREWLLPLQEGLQI